jgi:hypothetical protein
MFCYFFKEPFYPLSKEVLLKGRLSTVDLLL